MAPASGTYRVRLLANAQSETGADGKPLRLSFYAFDPTEEQLPKRYRLERAAWVADVDIPFGSPRWIECDVPIEAGETFHVYCANRFPADRFPVGDLNRSEINKIVKEAKNDPAPTVELRGMKVDGPVDIPPRVREFFGAWPLRLNALELKEKLLPLATRAFRRPLTEREWVRLMGSILAHEKKTGEAKFAWHYAIRRLLCSPEFLYREMENPGPLSPFALASRLSYFLWSGMPDRELLELAASGRLSDPTVLAAQTRRLIEDPRAQEFVKHFSGQWLGNRIVASINVCDNRYQWDDNVRYGFIRSTEMFFAEVLRENLPIATFIDSDFSYANSAMRAVWGMKGGEKLGAVAARQRQSLVWPEPTRLELTQLPEGAPGHLRARGGVLGLPGVLTVTGDGVNASPILRGVWVLENLFGAPPPPPPKDVPALDIDVSQARSVRETLKRHTEIESCAKCHRRIDPLGLALENYDAIGGWRESYPGNAGEGIDARAMMPNGIALDGPSSIKQYLLENRAIFTRCLVTKLLEYGAGRSLSIGDERVIEALVAQEPNEGYGFQDLIVAAVTSGVFLNK